MGVGGGSFIFFLSLSVMSAYLGRRLSEKWIMHIDRTSTYLFLAFAALLAYRAIAV